MHSLIQNYIAFKRYAAIEMGGNEMRTGKKNPVIIISLFLGDKRLMITWYVEMFTLLYYLFKPDDQRSYPVVSNAHKLINCDYKSHNCSCNIDHVKL